MPIKFRCRHCQQFLGISRSRAGEITNCPQCGKAIRIPALDGTVVPIPAPKLNLEDAELADALTELAQLESGPPSEPAVARRSDLPTVRIREPRASSAQAQDTTASVSAVTTPITAPEREASTSPARPELTNEDDPHAALSSLAELAADAMPSSATRAKHNSRWKLLLPGVGFVLLLTFVLLLREGDRPDGSLPPVPQDSTDPGDADEASERDANAEVEESAPAMTGRVNYISDTSDSRPDSGAVVMLLPFPRKGQLKLDESGFLFGADEVDTRAASAALRALGGDVTTTDDDGRFKLDLNSTGNYRMLVISHHQRRSTSQTVETKMQETLSGYFFRPATLLGQLAYQFDDFQYRGQGTSTRDITFAPE